ncbi:MAG TPA: hypothetical protein EYH40_01885 [Desulfurococcales archaeon]|nr:hypothetical protein [Desulfurococcales archaeon]
MSEECSDFIDNRAKLLVRPPSSLEVKITKHLIERFYQRKARDYKRIDLTLIRNVVYNVLRDGKYYATTSTVIVYHPTYTLIGCFDRDQMVLKTIIKTSELEEKLRKFMSKSYRVKWRNIIILTPKFK